MTDLETVKALLDKIGYKYEERTNSYDWNEYDLELILDGCYAGAYFRFTKDGEFVDLEILS